MEKNRAIPSLKRTFAGISQAIPKWLLPSIIAFLLGIGLASLINKVQSTTISNLPEAQTIVLNSPSYYLAYDGKTRGPSWILETIRLGEGSVDKKQYTQDRAIPSLLQTSPFDYKNSGYKITPLASPSDGGFLNAKIPMSICSPMLPEVNLVYWSKLEHYSKTLAQKMSPLRVLAITGPLYLPRISEDEKKEIRYELIGVNDIAVPTHFFKALFYLDKSSKSLKSDVKSEIYVIPNQNLKEDLPLDSFLTPLKELEKMSGIVFPNDIRSYLKLPKPPR